GSAMPNLNHLMFPNKSSMPFGEDASRSEKRRVVAATISRDHDSGDVYKISPINTNEPNTVSVFSVA
ncbi:MAG: hypothetical protein ACRC46_12785, partial [Thermoguttaceae bacterium]